MIVKKWYTVEPYNLDVLVAVCDSMKEIDNWVVKKYGGSSDENSSFRNGYCYQIENDQLGSIFWLIAVIPSVDYYRIAHESLHAAVRILELVGISTTANDSESCAYLVEYLMKLVNKTIALYEKKQAKDKST